MAAVPSVLLRPDSGTLRSGNHGDGALSRCSLTAGFAGAAHRSATSSTTVSGSPGSTNQTARKSSNHAPFPREEQLSITAAAAAFVSKTPPELLSRVPHNRNHGSGRSTDLSDAQAGGSPLRRAPPSSCGSRPRTPRQAAAARAHV